MDVFDPTEVKASFEAFKSVIETYKSLREQFKKQPDAYKELGIDIEQAEKEVLLAEAQIAKSIGYKLCRAHFPPVPMLLDRIHPQYGDEISKCPECAREYPSSEAFKKLDDRRRKKSA